ncbi:MAG: hypothetical protein Ta2E_09790 [Mycoplasmoidaceae bacterium]|nr:MAG: hypothetical protein Ta2E_09790 [Mycoplasmoidaceae bacterium]
MVKVRKVFNIVNGISKKKRWKWLQGKNIVMMNLLAGLISVMIFQLNWFPNLENFSIHQLFDPTLWFFIFSPWFWFSFFDIKLSKISTICSCNPSIQSSINWSRNCWQNLRIIWSMQFFNGIKWSLWNFEIFQILASLWLFRI